MEASYFYSIVLPLGIFVFLLTAIAYYYARKEELARRNWRKLMDTYTKKQLGWREDPNVEDYYEMKLEKALGQLDIGTGWNSQKTIEEAQTTDPQCSEEDSAYNVT